MTRDDVVKIIRSVAPPEFSDSKVDEDALNEIMPLLLAVAAHEREECAKVCDTLVSSYQKKDDKYGTESDATFYGASIGAEECASAIRARGELL